MDGKTEWSYSKKQCETLFKKLAQLNQRIADSDSSLEADACINMRPKKSNTKVIKKKKEQASLHYHNRYIRCFYGMTAIRLYCHLANAQDNLDYVLTENAEAKAEYLVKEAHESIIIAKRHLTPSWREELIALAQALSKDLLALHRYAYGDLFIELPELDEPYDRAQVAVGKTTASSDTEESPLAQTCVTVTEADEEVPLSSLERIYNELSPSGGARVVHFSLLARAVDYFNVSMTATLRYHANVSTLCHNLDEQALQFHLEISACVRVYVEVIRLNEICTRNLESVVATKLSSHEDHDEQSEELQEYWEAGKVLRMGLSRANQIYLHQHFYLNHAAKCVEGASIQIVQTGEVERPLGSNSKISRTYAFLGLLRKVYALKDTDAAKVKRMLCHDLIIIRTKDFEAVDSEIETVHSYVAEIADKQQRELQSKQSDFKRYVDIKMRVCQAREKKLLEAWDKAKSKSIATLIGHMGEVRKQCADVLEDACLATPVRQAFIAVGLLQNSHYQLCLLEAWQDKYTDYLDESIAFDNEVVTHFPALITVSSEMLLHSDQSFRIAQRLIGERASDAGFSHLMLQVLLSHLNFVFYAAHMRQQGTDTTIPPQSLSGFSDKVCVVMQAYQRQLEAAAVEYHDSEVVLQGLRESLLSSLDIKNQKIHLDAYAMHVESHITVLRRLFLLIEKYDVILNLREQCDVTDGLEFANPEEVALSEAASEQWSNLVSKYPVTLSREQCEHQVKTLMDSVKRLALQSRMRIANLRYDSDAPSTPSEAMGDVNLAALTDDDSGMLNIDSKRRDSFIQALRKRLVESQETIKLSEAQNLISTLHLLSADHFTDIVGQKNAGKIEEAQFVEAVIELVSYYRAFSPFSNYITNDDLCLSMYRTLLVSLVRCGTFVSESERMAVNRLFVGVIRSLFSESALFSRFKTHGLENYSHYMNDIVTWLESCLLQVKIQKLCLVKRSQTLQSKMTDTEAKIKMAVFDEDMGNIEVMRRELAEGFETYLTEVVTPYFSLLRSYQSAYDQLRHFLKENKIPSSLSLHEKSKPENLFDEASSVLGCGKVYSDEPLVTYTRPLKNQAMKVMGNHYLTEMRQALSVEGVKQQFAELGRLSKKELTIDECQKIQSLFAGECMTIPCMNRFLQQAEFLDIRQSAHHGLCALSSMISNLAVSDWDEKPAYSIALSSSVDFVRILEPCVTFVEKIFSKSNPIDRAACLAWAEAKLEVCHALVRLSQNASRTCSVRQAELLRNASVLLNSAFTHHAMLGEREVTDAFHRLIQAQTTLARSVTSMMSEKKLTEVSQHYHLSLKKMAGYCESGVVPQEGSVARRAYNTACIDMRDALKVQLRLLDIRATMLNTLIVYRQKALLAQGVHTSPSEDGAKAFVINELPSDATFRDEILRLLTTLQAAQKAQILRSRGATSFELYQSFCDLMTLEGLAEDVSKKITECCQAIIVIIETECALQITDPLGQFQSHNTLLSDSLQSLETPLLCGQAVSDEQLDRVAAQFRQNPLHSAACAMRFRVLADYARFCQTMIRVEESAMAEGDFSVSGFIKKIQNVSSNVPKDYSAKIITIYHHAADRLRQVLLEEKPASDDILHAGIIACAYGVPIFQKGRNSGRKKRFSTTDNLIIELFDVLHKAIRNKVSDVVNQTKRLERDMVQVFDTMTPEQFLVQNKERVETLQQMRRNLHEFMRLVDPLYKKVSDNATSSVLVTKLTEWRRAYHQPMLCYQYALSGTYTAPESQLTLPTDAQFYGFLSVSDTVFANDMTQRAKQAHASQLKQARQLAANQEAEAKRQAQAHERKAEAQRLAEQKAAKKAERERHKRAQLEVKRLAAERKVQQKAQRKAQAEQTQVAAEVLAKQKAKILAQEVIRDGVSIRSQQLQGRLPARGDADTAGAMSFAESLALLEQYETPVAEPMPAPKTPQHKKPQQKAPESGTRQPTKGRQAKPSEESIYLLRRGSAPAAMTGRQENILPCDPAIIECSFAEHPMAHVYHAAPFQPSVHRGVVGYPTGPINAPHYGAWCAPQVPPIVDTNFSAFCEAALKIVRHAELINQSLLIQLLAAQSGEQVINPTEVLTWLKRICDAQPSPTGKAHAMLQYAHCAFYEAMLTDTSRGHLSEVRQLYDAARKQFTIAFNSLAGRVEKDISEKMTILASLSEYSTTYSTG